MNKLFFLCFPLFCLGIGTLEAQRIYGAEMYKSSFVDTTEVEIRIWREGGAKSYVLFDWGDGSPLDTANLIADVLIDATGSPSRHLNIYRLSHEYAESGLYRLGFTDSFLVEDIVNIEHSGDKPLMLYDTVSIFDPADTQLNSNTSPEFFNRALLPLENGKLSFPMNNYVDEVVFFMDRHAIDLVPFPAEGFTYPDATDSLYMLPPANTTMIWEKPVSPGRYALGFKVREEREYNQETYLLSTTLRAMTFVIDEDMIVSTSSPSAEALPLQLYPNPSSSSVHIALPGGAARPGQVCRAFDATGRLIWQTVATGQEVLTVDVSAWPPGIYYFVSLGGTAAFVKQ